MLVATRAVRSEPLTYEIEFAPRGSPADVPLTMFCSETSRCEGEIELHIGEKVQSVTVIPLFIRDRVILRLSATNMPLTVNGQRSVDIPLDLSRTQMTLTVRGPDIAEERGPAENLVARFIQWPVKVFAETVDVYIRPSH
jgi:hypothetical protein